MCLLGLWICKEGSSVHTKRFTKNSENPILWRIPFSEVVVLVIKGRGSSFKTRNDKLMPLLHTCASLKVLWTWKIPLPLLKKMSHHFFNPHLDFYQIFLVFRPLKIFNCNDLPTPFYHDHMLAHVCFAVGNRHWVKMRAFNCTHFKTFVNMFWLESALNEE